MVRYDAYDGTTIILIATLLPLSLITVVLRFVARSKTRSSYGLDDLLAIVALAFYISTCVLNLWGALAIPR